MHAVHLFISGSEIFIILLVVLLLFGANKLPEIARGLGKGMNEFKRATRDIRSEFDEQTRDIQNEMKGIKKDIEDQTQFNMDDGFFDEDSSDTASGKKNYGGSKQEDDGPEASQKADDPDSPQKGDDTGSSPKQDNQGPSPKGDDPDSPSDKK